MNKEVKIIRDGMLWTGVADIMHDEDGAEVLLVKLSNRRPGIPTDKEAAEEHVGERKVKKVKRNAARRISKSQDPEPVVLEVKRRPGRQGIPVVCKTTNVRFNSMKEAAETLFPDLPVRVAAHGISCCCRGVQDNTRGMQFEYAQ